MKDTTIKFSWVKSGYMHQKEIDRKAMFDVFDGVRKGFEGDNRISRALVEDIIPNADSIFINKDFNDTQTEPSISYKIDGKSKLLKIIRYHKIVWAIFDKYCTE